MSLFLLHIFLLAELWTEFLSVHAATIPCTAASPAPLPATAEPGNTQPRSETTSIPYYQEGAHCRSQGRAPDPDQEERGLLSLTLPDLRALNTAPTRLSHQSHLKKRELFGITLAYRHLLHGP
ncbi:hypothetical protein EYF80_005103 [Liparis tanakae]|uniref:Uncharacterized protein n=1 Tax=Liparis tanakae TaxID=230148 RepID=A0A4Z2J4S2_9TELE|nr:hypothetical protein EYF80_005103 [Liparis tanakae]